MPGVIDPLAQQFLAAYANGTTVDAGWSFAKALQQSRLDFSDESLDRLDRFFDAVRTRARPTLEVLRDTAPGRNCCSLLAFYVIEIVRRRTGARLEWHDRESALNVLPASVELPEGSLTRLIALAPDAGALFLPLPWIEEQMLGTRPPTTAADYIAGTVAQIEHDMPSVWRQGMEAMGWFASMKMISAAAGHPVFPSMLQANHPREIVEWRGDSAAISASVQVAARLLELNPDGASWQIIAYDGYMDDKQGRLDALMVVLHTYASPPLQIKIAFPYRPASDSRPFAILRPSLLAANVENEAIARMQGTLERGLQAVVWPAGESWNQYRDNAEDTPAVATASAHHVASQPADPTLEALIATLRESFGQRQSRLSERTLASLVMNPPAWMKSSDGLSEVFRQQRLLLREGQIVWGALVQANNLLFEPGTSDHPAMLVYSSDRYFDVRPAELRLIGSKVFALKGTDPADPELNSLARLITEEVDRSMGLRLPPVFSPRDLRSAVFMVFRRHIPNGVLSCGLFPILTHPTTDAVLIVPFEFWPAELTILWRDRRL
jgi:hypothetical protein